MTNLYTAITEAADHIERNPADFFFESGAVPESDASTDSFCSACALAWIGYFLNRQVGSRQYHWWDGVAYTAFGLTAYEIYVRLHGFEPDWKNDAAACARALRQYAERYHGHEKPKPRADELDKLIADINKAVAGQKVLEYV
jgi:hypothetical protein